jgi:hypothetical protein
VGLGTSSWQCLNVFLRVVIGEELQSFGAVFDDPMAGRADLAQPRFGVTGVVLDELGIDGTKVFIEIPWLRIELCPRVVSHIAILRLGLSQFARSWYAGDVLWLEVGRCASE